MTSFSVDRLIAPSKDQKPAVIKKVLREESRLNLGGGLKQEPAEEKTKMKSEERKISDAEDAAKEKRMALAASTKQENRCSMPGKTNKPNSKEDSRHVETFVAVIAQAILSAPGKRMTLSSIYHYIASKYSHFNREKGPGWRNSVRHNLSSNDCFVKAGRAENGKGHYWMIHPKDLPEFSKGNFRRRRKPRRPRCHHAVMFNGGSENAFFYHTLAAASIPLSMTASQDRVITSSPMNFGLVDTRKLPLMGHYDRPQYLDMSRTGLSVPSSLLWPSEISTRTFPKFTSSTGSLNFQLCACRSPGLQCYYHKC